MTDKATMRDPRLSPIVGDVFESTACSSALPYLGTVTKVTRCFVTTTSKHGASRTSLRRWRAWAKTATVVKKGDQP